jgi:hypothetical protein
MGRAPVRATLNSSSHTEELTMHSTSPVVVPGPLAPFAAGFDAELARLGYTPDSAYGQLRLAAELSGSIARLTCIWGLRDLAAAV